MQWWFFREFEYIRRLKSELIQSSGGETEKTLFAWVLLVIHGN